MENSEREWAVAQMEYLNPPTDWRPDAGAALTRLHARMDAKPFRAPWWRWPAWVAVAAFLFLVLWPAGRVLAQQFWQFLAVHKVAFVRVNKWPEGVPSPQVKVIGLPIPPQRAKDIDEARWRVHYDPRLPHAGVLSGTPQLSTTFSLAAGTVIKVADLELALRKAGITDQTVPARWDGAQVALHTSAMVIAEWPDVALVQSLPLTLTAPPGFDFAEFSGLILRVVGVGPDEASRLAESAGTVPPWLAPISRELKAGATIEEINLNSGSATLVQEEPVWGMAGPVTIVWTVPDRVYLLHGGLSRELAIAVANAVQ